MTKTINLFCILFLIYSCNGQNKKDNSTISIYKTPIESYVIDSVMMNLKTKNLKIIVLEKNKNKNTKTYQHNSLSVVVLKKKDNNYLKIKLNEKISFAYNDNCPADGFQAIKNKNNYFTIEQTYCLDFKYVYSYTTFKVDQKSGYILLHKFGETYTNRSNPSEKIPERIWSNKDFGIVQFENVTEDFLKGLRKNNPKI